MFTARQRKGGICQILHDVAFFADKYDCIHAVKFIMAPHILAVTIMPTVPKQTSPAVLFRGFGDMLHIVILFDDAEGFARITKYLIMHWERDFHQLQIRVDKIGRLPTFFFGKIYNSVAALLLLT